MSPIKCLDYVIGDDVDKDIMFYVNEGIFPMVDEYQLWGWFWFLPSYYAMDFSIFNRQI